MVLRKPYAFLIKHFKLIHIIMTVAIIYLMIKTEHIIDFLNEYIHSNNIVIGQNITSTLFTPYIFIWSIVILLFSIILLAVMVKKDKPRLFYAISGIIYIVSFSVYLYGQAIMGQMENVIVEPRTVKAVYDLFMFIMIAQGVSVIFFFIRGIGFDFKKFDFSRDMSDLDISQEDNEEFEVDLDLDFNDSVRRYKKAIRYFKYFYKENKFIINIASGLLVAIVCYYLYNNINIFTKVNKQGISFYVNGFTMGIMDTYLVDTDKQGKMISDDSVFLIANIQVKNENNKPTPFAPGSIELIIGNATYHHNAKYKEYFTDLGVVYENNEVKNNFTNYLLVYEIPKSKQNKRMKIRLTDTDSDQTILVKVKYEDLTKTDEVETVLIGQSIDFNGTALKNSTLTINDYSIADQYENNYLFCLKNGRCVDSKEYLRPTYGDVNYDEALLKLNASFTLDEETNSYKINDFYSLFSNFVTISYEINGKQKSQSTNFKQVKSTKKKDKDIYYIEVNKELEEAQNISLNFNVRNKVYKYYLN